MLDHEPEKWCQPCGAEWVEGYRSAEQEALEFLGPMEEEMWYDYDEEEALEDLKWCTSKADEGEEERLGHPTDLESPGRVGEALSKTGPTFGPQPGMYPPGFMGSEDDGIGVMAPSTPTEA